MFHDLSEFALGHFQEIGLTQIPSNHVSLKACMAFGSDESKGEAKILI